jgi:hypothetical protein
MTTDIDTKLTTIEDIDRLGDAVNLIVLRKTFHGWEIGTAVVTDDDETKAANNQPIQSMMCEGVPHDIEFRLESATGNTLGDVVRDVLTQADLPY